MSDQDDVSTTPKRTILIVDDDKVVRMIAMKTLAGNRNLDVREAADGATALQLARDLVPDLILTDALLPGLDGRELSLRVKSDPALRGTKVVVMTALYKGARYKNEAMKDFLADEYIEKPLTPDKLRWIVARTLGTSEPELARAS